MGQGRTIAGMSPQDQLAAAPQRTKDVVQGMAVLDRNLAADPAYMSAVKSGNLAAAKARMQEMGQYLQDDQIIDPKPGQAVPKPQSNLATYAMLAAMTGGLGLSLIAP